MTILELTSPYFVSALFGLLRLAPACIMLPLTGGLHVPRVVSVALAALMATFWALLVPDDVHWLVVDALTANTIQLVVVVSREVLLGLLLGFVLGFVFRAAVMTANLLETAIGLPHGAADAQGPLERFYPLLLMVAFLVVGGMRSLLFTLLQSYAVWPVGGVSLALDPDWLSQLCAFWLSSAIAVALPVLVGLLLVDLVFAVSSRLVPGLHAFFLSMPLKYMLGLLLVSLGLWLGIHELLWAEDAIVAPFQGRY